MGTMVATVLANSFLVAHSASLLELSLRSSFRNWRDKVTLSKPHNILLSGDVNVSTISIFKQKGCNDFALEPKNCFSTTIPFIDIEAVEHGQLYKMNGHLLVPLQ